MIIFDLDDTLYNQLDVFKNAIEAVFKDRKLKENTLVELFEHRQQYSNQALVLYQKKLMSQEEMYIYRISQAFSAIGIQIDRKEALSFQEAYSYFQTHLSLDSQMEKVLDYLSDKNYLIGLLSNGSVKHQHKKIDQLSLSKWIKPEHQFVSGHFGIDKPDPNLFLEVEKIVPKPKETLIMIGDSYENDILGARKVGWQSIFLDKYGWSSKNTSQADYTVNNGTELLLLMKQILD